jgi:hypothetical protein
MPSLPQRKLSEDPVFLNLMGGDRLVVLRTPQQEPDATKRNGTVGLEALAAALAVPLGIKSGTAIKRLDIPSANVLLTNTPPADQVQEATWYTIDGDWNATGNDTRVTVWGLAGNAFSPVGIFQDETGALSFVEVDVVAGTAVPAQVDAYTKAETDQQRSDDTEAWQQADSQIVNKIGPLSTLATTAKNHLVAAINELAGRAVATYYAATGQHTDGAMTQKATTDALATKVERDDLPLDWLWNANITSQHTSANPAPLAPNTLARLNPYAEATTDFYVSLPPAWFGKGTKGTTLAFHAATAGTLHFADGFLVDKAPTLTLAAGSSVVLSATSEGRSTRTDTSGVNYTVVLASGAGGAGTVKTVNGLAPDASGDVSLPATDRYDVPPAVRDAVLAGTFSSGELNGAQPAGSLAGQRFTSASFGYEYERGAGGALVWCRYPKN